MLDRLDASVDKLSTEFSHTSSDSNAEGDLLVARAFMAMFVLGGIRRRRTKAPWARCRNTW